MNHQSVTVFSGIGPAALVVFQDKKGNTHNITPEGALFKGGAALKSLKDSALMSAFEKAVNGRYRQACDIISAAFGSTAKAYDKVIGTPWANKQTMQSFLLAVERAQEPDKGWSQKQVVARMLVNELRAVPGLEKPELPLTIESEQAVETATN